jgi:ABC-type oligopeptide transport system substrate-binding subunit
VALAGCAAGSPYFGKTTPPGSQRLVHSNGEEPNSLDPALAVGSNGETIVAALLDSLTALDPITLSPAAGLATHYEVDNRATRYTFFLRGHPKPRGIRLPNTDSLPAQFAAGHRAPPDTAPAFWSDSTPITARDFVYAWRRLVNPATGAWAAFYLAPIINAREIVNGAKSPDTLAARALDDLTFQFELAKPQPSFLRLLWQPFLAALPRHVIEAARRSARESSWTEPGTFVSSGPFVLKDWKPNDRVVVVKNPRYWEAESVAIEEIVFLPISNGVTNVNLYRTGVIHSMNPRLIPPLLAPRLINKRDFGTSPALRTVWYALNVTTAPLDRVLVRYALNVATDKLAIANFVGTGQKRANGIVPPMADYPSQQKLRVSIGGRDLDIFAFDVRAARDLLRSEGISRLDLSLVIPTRPRSREIAVIPQQQWREHLGIRLQLSEQEETVWEQTVIRKQYLHVVEDSWIALCDDPNDYLVGFGPAHNSVWTDLNFDREFTRANEMAEPAARLKALAACEAQLMKAMPIVPLFHDSWAYLEAPYVGGLTTTPFGHPRFKYARIETTWRPS